MRTLKKDNALRNKIQGYYVDQAFQLAVDDDHCIISGLTPWGVHGIDSTFIDRIRSMTTIAEAEQIKRDIKANPHLHAKIKENLLLNLITCQEKLLR